MSSNPPPKEGEVTTSSTKIRQLVREVEATKVNLNHIEMELEELLKNAGYDY